MLRVLVFLLVLAVNLHGQLGDSKDKGEQQIARVPAERIPPAPVLDPAAALKSFTVQPGFRVELVAAEPLVKDPVAMAFDGAGRIWVVEMSGYMRDFEATDEREPLGAVAVLEDINRDGKMDKRTVFADGLVMPRAIALVDGGVLIAEPPFLFWCKDTNGDLRCDQKVQISDSYGDTKNPEHTANGLLWGRDNWIYNANLTARHKYRGTNQWQINPTSFRGQWGIAQDDYGRLVYNSNSDQFRIDLIPASYLQRNAHLRAPIGVNVDPIGNQDTWPIRVTPGVNRGYREGVLREDGTLAKFTAACAPLIYRGNNFPAEYYGNAFVCEPSGNLIKRNILAEENGQLRGWQAYTNAEFLASSDERFRPVNLFNGLDGGLYIVDLYRGVIQHKIYLTTYLRQQSESRQLQAPIGYGRIYRIVHENKPLEKPPQVARSSATELARLLSNQNGAVRDLAQQLLVERNDRSALTVLKRMAVSHQDHRTRLHALWTLEGMNALDEKTLIKALRDRHEKVKAAAIRLSESFIKAPGGERLLTALLQQTKDKRHDVQLQLALTLANIPCEQADSTLAGIAVEARAPIIHDAVISGLHKRELEFLLRIVSQRQPMLSEANVAFLRRLSQCVFIEGDANRVAKLLEVAAAGDAWFSDAILAGISDTMPASRSKSAPKIKPVRLSHETAAVKEFRGAAKKETRELFAQVERLISWPGKPGDAPEETARSLTAEEQKRFVTGKELYLLSCNACHQPTGLGLEGLAPPLADSEWVHGSEERLARIVLHGVKGPLLVKGRKWELEMPGLPFFDDEQIAAILTYVRREWQNTGEPVTADTVKRIRNETASRTEAWSEAELLEIP